MKRAILLLAFATRVFAAEVPVAEPLIIPGSTTFHRHWPVIAAGDAGFLVTWEESAFGVYPGPVMFRAYDRHGTPLQPTATRIGSDDGRSPHVVWNGSEYLLAYARALSRFGSPSPVPALIAMRISAQGKIIEGSQVTLANAHGTGELHDLEWLGTQAVMLAAIDSVPHMLRLSAHGAVTRSDRLLVRPADLAAYDGRLVAIYDRDGDAAALNAEKVAAVENTGAGVIVNFLSVSLQLLGGFVLAPKGSSANSIVWDGSAWVTAFVDGGDVCTARFTAEDDVVRSCRGETNVHTPAIGVHGGRSFAAWSHERKQIITDGGMASTAIAAQWMPDATIDPAGLLVAWTESNQLRVGGVGRPIHPVGTRNPPQTPRLSNGGAQSLLVWSEANTIRATRLDANGEPVPPIVDLGAGSWPSMTTDGTNWLVAWRGNDGVVSTLVTPNLDSNGLQHYGAAETLQGGPQVSITPSGFLVVWNETQLAPEGDHDRIVAEALDANGLRISGGVRVADRIDGTRTHWLAARCVGERCLIAWDEIAPDSRVNLVSVVVGADARPLTEPRALRSVPAPARKAIVPFEAGGFRLYSGGMLFILGPGAETLDTQQWTTHDNNDLGSAVIFRGRIMLVYSRDFRVFVRDFASRGRAVRH